MYVKGSCGTTNKVRLHHLADIELLLHAITPICHCTYMAEWLNYIRFRDFYACTHSYAIIIAKHISCYENIIVQKGDIIIAIFSNMSMKSIFLE